ncbi:ATP-grasp domain-containing protein [Methanolobus vulcani]|uniref:ATP-grasp domain-containing protein n=1 Tax=Methanolobus vulcani TaxID=38026 RepID=A0A7Z8KR56_9EURY|nr:ATP-grasp domain-containing protein [Methanolobus vulcani]TQD27258.1 ATP-grasp domain-containing protein [Methanolobus vulcani]
MSKVFVTDGRSRASLAIVRSLGHNNIQVVCGESFDCPAFYSKYCSHKYLYSPPNKNPDLFLESILKTVKENNYDTIMPVRDDTTLLLSKNRSLFEDYFEIPITDYDKLMIGRDKSKTIKFALANNIPCPQTYFPSEMEDLLDLEADLSFPLVIKPHQGSGSRGIQIVNSYEELITRYDDVCCSFGPSMLQEFIPYGGAYGVSMLLKEGEIKASFTHKRLREYPQSGGPSTLRESVEYPQIEKYASTLLKKLKWHGVAMVEFRIDARNNKPILMEINPRFWGSLQLAISSGIDFPNMLYTLAVKGDVEPQFSYKVGVKSRWLLFGDILWYLKCENKIKQAPAFFSKEGAVFDICSRDDPLPIYGTIKYGAYKVLSKEWRSHVFNRGWGLSGNE